MQRFGIEVSGSVAQLIRSRESLAKNQQESIAEQRSKLVQSAEAAGLVETFGVNQQNDAAMDRLRAIREGGGDTMKERKLLQQFAAQRNVTLYDQATKMMKRGGAEGEAAKAIRGQLGEELIGLGTQRIDLIRDQEAIRNRVLEASHRKSIGMDWCIKRCTA